MDKFNFEELCLMRIFDTSGREALRDEPVDALHYVDGRDEPDLIPLFGSTIEKLDNLTHEEFSALSAYFDVEDFYAEGDDAFGE